MVWVPRALVKRLRPASGQPWPLRGVGQLPCSQNIGHAVGGYFHLKRFDRTRVEGEDGVDMIQSP